MLLVVIINCNRLFYHYVIKNGNTKEEITTFTVEEIIHRIFYQCTMWLSRRVNSPCAQWGKKENRMCYLGYTCEMLAPPCMPQVS